MYVICLFSYGQKASALAEKRCPPSAETPALLCGFFFSILFFNLQKGTGKGIKGNIELVSGRPPEGLEDFGFSSRKGQV